MNKKKFVIATHVWAHGPAQDLRRYLIANAVQELLYIGHPLFYDKRLNGNGYELYLNGKNVQKRYSTIKKIPSVLAYIKDAASTIYFVLRHRGCYDIFFGFNNLNAISGWLLKKTGKVKKCVYYVVDYTPIRFENMVLNTIYHWVETFCALHCDETWNLSERMIEAREEFKGINRSKCGMQKVVPMGLWYDEVCRYEGSAINKHQLVFMGHILKKQGIQYVLDAVTEIIKEISDFRFLVIGSGEYLSVLKQKARDLKIEKYVHFTGYLEKHEDAEQLIASSALAVALYEKEKPEKNWTYYADPGKIKSYLGGGVPVLLTDVPPNAKEIEENECGKIIQHDPDSIAQAVISIMKDDEALKRYRNNALNYIQKFKWERIFNKAIL